MSKFNLLNPVAKATKNKEGAVAYKMSDEQKLLSMVINSFFSGSFYEKDELNELKTLVKKI